MVWIIAIACLAVVGAIGYAQGPVRSLFSLFGLIFGALLAGALSPLAKPLLPLLGLHNEVWSMFVPQTIALVVVLIVFMIAGNVVHQKVLVHFKYNEDDARYFVWHRLYTRLGFCVGLFNGAVYFVLLMIPIYLAGYFAQAVANASEGATLPGGVQFLARTRAELHSLRLDRVFEAYDPIPKKIYDAIELVALVAHNPLLESRLSHYPPFLTLGQRPEFQALGNDLQLQQMIQSQAPVADILKYPSVQAILTNSTLMGEVNDLVGNDLPDLRQYLLTDQSPKYDPQTILGVWIVNPEATYGQLRKRGGVTPAQLRNNRMRMASFVPGLSILCTIDNEFILKKQNPTSPEASVVAVGKWQKDGDSYDVTLPGSKPPTTEIEIQNGVRILLPKDGDVLIFDKD